MLLLLFNNTVWGEAVVVTGIIDFTAQPLDTFEAVALAAFTSGALATFKADAIWTLLPSFLQDINGEWLQDVNGAGLEDVISGTSGTAKKAAALKTFEVKT